MKCKICEAEVRSFAKAKVLNKYDVDYFQCSKCSFVHTEEPYWLEEAYLSPISKSDVGLVARNIVFSKLASTVISNVFNSKAKFLDYGCGYGLLVRIMRDLGFDFYGYDKFCSNVFSQSFKVTQEGANCYEGVTAFEVFEHFINPIEEIEQILKFSRNILFSTELLPASNPKPTEWYYYAAHEGQHISIYSNRTLSILAKKFDLNLYSNELSIHLLTEKRLPSSLADTLNFCRYEPKRVIGELRRTLVALEDASLLLGTLTSEPRSETSEAVRNSLKIIIDGIFFQLYKTGIARVWRSLLEEWGTSDFAKYITVLDRAETAPKVPGIRYVTVPAYDYGDINSDREMLQQLCNEEEASLFVSTYYTTPISTPSIFVAYDMIPEVMGWDLNHPMWQDKHNAIQHASAHIAISANTALDLTTFFPDIPLKSVTVAPCGVESIFSAADQEEIASFKTKYGISKPYFILVGTTGGYKNGSLFFQAFHRLSSKQGFDIICTGSGSVLEAEFRACTSSSAVHMMQLDDRELKVAYSGAVALVYPSKYEGFGLPVLEAVACGCPVITCPNASIPEVAGEAALYVNDKDVNGMVDALCDIQKPDIRNSLIAAGLEQAKKFSWSKMAKTISSTLIETSLLPLKLKEINLIVFPDWSQSEDSLSLDLKRVVQQISTHLEKDQITLLIYNSNIPNEDAELILSGIAMDLLIREDLGVGEGLEISIVNQLDEIQWESLLPHIQARIVLKKENSEAATVVGIDKIPSCHIDSFSVQQLA